MNLNIPAGGRKAIYDLIAAVFGVMVVWGLCTAENAQHVLDALVDLAPVFAAILARLNTGGTKTKGKHVAETETES